MGLLSLGPLVLALTTAGAGATSSWLDEGCGWEVHLGLGLIAITL